MQLIKTAENMSRVNPQLYETHNPYMHVFVDPIPAPIPALEPPGHYPDEDEARRRQNEGFRIFQQQQAQRSALNARKQRPPSEQPWTHANDTLSALISEQILTTDSRTYSTRQRDLVNIRIREIATALSDHLRRGIIPGVGAMILPINLQNMLQRTALAAFLKPIYQEFSNYLHSETSFSYLFCRRPHNEFLINQVWYNLHLYLTQHGFSIANVHRFIGDMEERNEPVSLQHLSYDRVRSDLRAEDTAPEILQFSPNWPPVEQAIFDRMLKSDRERLTALATASHPRLGEHASPLAGLLSMGPDMRGMILEHAELRGDTRLLRSAGYNGGTSRT